MHNHSNGNVLLILMQIKLISILIVEHQYSLRNKDKHPLGIGLFIYIGMLQLTGHPKEIPGKFTAIPTGCQSAVLFAKNLWLVMILDLKGIIAVKT